MELPQKGNATKLEYLKERKSIVLSCESDKDSRGDRFSRSESASRRNDHFTDTRARNVGEAGRSRHAFPLTVDRVSSGTRANGAKKSDDCYVQQNTGFSTLYTPFRSSTTSALDGEVRAYGHGVKYELHTNVNVAFSPR